MPARPLVPKLEAEWSSVDRIALDAFLNTQTGRNFLDLLAVHRPGFSASIDATKRLVESGRVEGFDAAFSTIQRARTLDLVRKTNTQPT